MYFAIYEHLPSSVLQVASSLKRAEQESYSSQKKAGEQQQQAAAERREKYLAQRTLSAKKKSRKIVEAKVEHTNKLKEKRVALEQKMNDATARRNVIESCKISKSQQKRSRSPTLLEIPVEGFVDSAANTVKEFQLLERLSSYSSPCKRRETEDPHEAEAALKAKLQNVEQRRQQHIQKRALSPKSKQRAEKVAMNREKLLSSKQEAAGEAEQKMVTAEARRHEIQTRKIEKVCSGV